MQNDWYFDFVGYVQQLPTMEDGSSIFRQLQRDLTETIPEGTSRIHCNVYANHLREFLVDQKRKKIGSHYEETIDIQIIRQFAQNSPFVKGTEMSFHASYTAGCLDSVHVEYFKKPNRFLRLRDYTLEELSSTVRSSMLDACTSAHYREESLNNIVPFKQVNN